MGGGVVRTAAKALGIYWNAIPRSAGRSQASSVATHQDPATVHPLSSAVGASPLSAIPVETSSSVVDGWEFLGGKEEALFDAIHPSSRLVFGPSTTFEEAKEAASDLKDALQMAYSSSSITDVHVSKQDLLCIEKSEERDSTITSAMLLPKHVEQAFFMIRDNPEAQNVVASLACDPYVWNAVENNPKFMNFIETYRSEYSTTDYDVTSASESCSYADSSMPKANYHQHEDYVTTDSTKAGEGSSFADSYEPKESMFTRFMKNIKAKTSHFFKHLSDLLQDNNTAAEKGVDGRIATTFIGLAMATIFIIIFKRG